MTPSRPLACLAVLCSLLGALPAATRAGPLRDRLRERIAQRAGERIAPPSASRLGADAALPGPGLYEIHLRHGGRDRMALVQVPRVYDAGKPAPLVMALHGGGGGAIYQASDELYGLISKSEEAGFIAVFPNGVSETKNGMLATWNAGNCCAKARDEKVDDTGFLRALVADLGRRASLAPGRVYAIGMSNGAMMAYRLACEAPEVFRGIMAVAGTDNTVECAPRQPVAILHIHARDDDRVLFEGGAGAKFRREQMVTDFTSVPATIEKWTRLDHASAEPRRVLEVAGAWCDLHAAGPDGAPVELCVTETGGHSWPGGGKGRGDAAPSQAIRANDLMWEFFSRL